MSNLKKKAKNSLLQTSKRSSAIQRKKAHFSKPDNDILKLQKNIGNQAVQRLYETSSDKEISSVAPDKVELKNMPIFQPPASIANWLDKQKKRKGKIKVQYGKLAEGTITVQKKSKERYIIKKQAIALQHPIFKKIGESSEQLQPRLIVETKKNNKIQGFITLKASSTRSQSIYSILKKSPEIIGLTGFKISKFKKITNKLDNGKLILGITEMPIKFAKVLDGSVSITTLDETINTFKGNLKVSAKGLSEGTLDIERKEDGKVTGKGEVELKLPKNFSGKMMVEWNGSVFKGEGKVGYAGEKLSGSITLNLMEESKAKQLEQENKTPKTKAIPISKNSKTKKEKYVVFGEGDLTFAFNEWLNGNAKVIVDPKGYITVIGEITPQKEFELFPQKDYNKELLKVKAKAAYGIPVVGNIFIFANIGLFAFAKLGPAKFYKIKVIGTYSTNPKKRDNFNIQGTLNVSAAAGLKLRGEAGAGLTILAHDIKAGAGINALAGIRGYAEATPIIGYREKAKEGEDKKGEFFIKGDFEISGQPFLGLSGDLFVEVDSPWLSPLPDKKWTWPLANKEWAMGGSFGVNVSMDYIFGSKQYPSIAFKKVNFSADKFLTDLYSDKSKAKSGDKGEQQSQWKERNTKKSTPSPQSKKANLNEGKSPKLSSAKSKVKAGGTKKNKDKSIKQNLGAINLDDLKKPPVPLKRTKAEKQIHYQRVMKIIDIASKGAKSTDDIEAYFPKIKKRYRVTSIQYDNNGKRLGIKIKLNPEGYFYNFADDMMVKSEEGEEVVKLNQIDNTEQSMIIKNDGKEIDVGSGGKTMTAKYLAFNHPRGSDARSANLKNIFKYLPSNPKLKGNQRYIRGHLLNAQIGGKAENKNLFPITHQANTDHKNKIEKEAKHLVNEKGFLIFYQVKANIINYGKSFINADFDCKLTTYELTNKGKLVPSDKAKIVKIKSRFLESKEKTEPDVSIVDKQDKEIIDANKSEDITSINKKSIKMSTFDKNEVKLSPSKSKKDRDKKLLEYKGKSLDDLQKIPGIGPIRAKKIIEDLKNLEQFET